MPFALGGIAQLGERLNGIQEVSGSIPLISTKALKLFRFQGFYVYCYMVFDRLFFLVKIS